MYDKVWEMVMVIIQNYYGLRNILKMTLFPATDRDAFILKFQGNNLPYASDFSVFEMWDAKSVVYFPFCKTPEYWQAKCSVWTTAIGH